MISRIDQVGISQRIRLEWLQQTANLVLAGSDQRSVHAALGELLQDRLSIGGNSERGNREKTITILMKIWQRPSTNITELHQAGLELLRTLSGSSHRAIHWGMVMAVYPFWGSVAIQVGRLLNLQGTVAASQVQRRIREQYGERETVSRATQRVLRSFIDWGVLRETPAMGIYAPGIVDHADHLDLVAWLVEAQLHALPEPRAPINAILNAPGLFPFRIRKFPAALLAENSRRLEVLRHGGDDDLIMLR